MPELTKLDPSSREFQTGQPKRGRTDPVALVRLLDEWMRDDEASLLLLHLGLGGCANVDYGSMGMTGASSC